MPEVANELDRYGWAFSAFFLASVVGAVAAGQDAALGVVVYASASRAYPAVMYGRMLAPMSPAWDGSSSSRVAA